MATGLHFDEAAGTLTYITIGNVSATELGYLDGVTSAIQTQIGSKATMVTAPASASSTGVAGQMAYDATHIYVCIATDTWVRADLATWS